MPFSYRGETRELDEVTRREAGGAFVRLPDGITHYELSNSEAEATVVFVHGFSTPYFIFDPTFDFLSQAGLRVLRYDLIGRGFSDRPETCYDINLFVRQLHDLLDALGLTDPVSLVGLSMGGPIIAAFTARSPERVDKLAFIDPAGVKRVFPRMALKAATIPGLGETLLNLIGSGGMVRIIASDFFDRTSLEHFQNRYLLQMRYKGFKHAILSTVRNGMLDSFMNDYQRIGKTDKPVLLFWGRHDHTVPLHHSQGLREAIPQAELYVIEDCGHLPHYEKPAEVNQVLLQFLHSEAATIDED